MKTYSQRKPAYKTCTEKFTARGMSQPPWCRKTVKSIVNIYIKGAKSKQMGQKSF